MTHEEFIQWLDEQIKFYDLMVRKFDNDNWNYLQYRSSKQAFEVVKERFLTLLPPPTTLS